MDITGDWESREEKSPREKIVPQEFELAREWESRSVSLDVVSSGHYHLEWGLLNIATKSLSEFRLGRAVGKIDMKSTRWVLGHSLVRSLVCSHHSLIRLLRTARFARALRCAHSFARSLTHSLPSSWERSLCLWNEYVEFIQIQATVGWFQGRHHELPNSNLSSVDDTRSVFHRLKSQGKTCLRHPRWSFIF